MGKEQPSELKEAQNENSDEADLEKVREAKLSAVERIAKKIDFENIEPGEVELMAQIGEMRQDLAWTYRHGVTSSALNSYEVRNWREFEEEKGEEALKDMERRYTEEMHGLLPDVYYQDTGKGWDLNSWGIFRREGGEVKNITQELADQGLDTKKKQLEYVESRQREFLAEFEALSEDEQWARVKKLMFLSAPQSFEELWGEADGIRYEDEVRKRIKERLIDTYEMHVLTLGAGISRGDKNILSSGDLEYAIRMANANK